MWWSSSVFSSYSQGKRHHPEKKTCILIPIEKRSLSDNKTTGWEYNLKSPRRISSSLGNPTTAKSASLDFEEWRRRITITVSVIRSEIRQRCRHRNPESLQLSLLPWVSSETVEGCVVDSNNVSMYNGLNDCSYCRKTKSESPCALLVSRLIAACN